MSQNLRIRLVGDEDKSVSAMLADLGHRVLDGDMNEEPDLIVTDDAATGDGHVPVILLSNGVRARIDTANVVAFVQKPVQQDALAAAISIATTLFADVQRLRQENVDLRRQLDERKLIEKAKGIVMTRLAIDEPQAYRRLRKLASDGNRKLVDMARSVIVSDEVFRQLEGS